MTEAHLISTPPGFADKPQALILIAEDEPEIADILTAYLKRSGFQTVHALDGRRALELHQSLKPDLVLLDVLMPKLDGWMVLAEIRHRGNTPVIMLTAQDQDMDKLMGLRIGADDYIVKPFNPAEVVARTQAVLRRSRDQGYGSGQSVLRVDAFEIDVDSHEVSVRIGTQNHALSLTATEFRLLAQLAKAPRRVFSRAELLASCSPESDSLERTVDSHISKLRRKIEDLGLQGVPASIRGVGYRFGSHA
ncbi:response regulator transcription factor [Pseudomonas lurida]|jgi:two-component system response regulator AdeR|uniref:Response regulator n=1 Tax=Pseudomonas quebecensis TaxID=2995174 RepID=A0ABY6QLR1_9PSED|nr:MULTISPECIES: response regulator [Pseudomonas]MBA1293190.1 response regulator transcription factor [Pseudomonas lurida]MCP1511255.1 two-component system response regulator AdeR [Pseudomonas rhodesiae]MCX4067513.1 response regulator [Pseudomonas quebecensis]MDF9770075.1 two-component system response regulator AdeR [Pseudomonas rhodesiae]UZW20907.1 response regulator [Pseudomonas quebecensis]